MKKLFFMSMMLLMSLTSMAQTKDQFISELMSKMTVEEKLGQLMILYTVLYIQNNIRKILDIIQGS